MTNANDEPAVDCPVERQVMPTLKALPGSDGYYLHAQGVSDAAQREQPEPLWYEQRENAEASAVAMAERTGWAVYVLQVVSKVVPWHQR